ncbi:hypothetical protein F966_01948 [Acinetobacter higginsii]|uniref:IraD/Gp25-like domain-containing protein n=1 Tax=Acinetobacter higginsii TaxID=70347 RepID=N8WAY9_9GAMM|nr:GPW/gp25 family protein [Acinetobacter higginsii]ENV09292.1 hypothetical protein F966_01948 [Acinetobacter higginsii]
MMLRESGRKIGSEIQSIEQSIADILTTPLGSRLMRRDYGSILPNLIDQPMNDALRLIIFSAVYSSILRWETRITIQRIQFAEFKKGAIVLEFDASLSSTNQPLNLNVPLQMGAIV